MTGLQPGRPLSLATDSDDIAALLTIIRAVTQTAALRSRKARVIREALWFLWEEPRLPRPLVSSKYPTSYPWSEAARERSVGLRPAGGYGLVFEHLSPRTELVQSLIDDAASLSSAELAAHLDRHLMAAVITVEEDARIRAAGFAIHRPEGSEHDPWARYRASGLDLENFAPLHQ